MHANSVNMQINAAIHLITNVQSAVKDLPQKHRRKLPDDHIISDILYRLEVAKAEVNGTPMPVKPAIEDVDGLSEIIDK